MRVLLSRFVADTSGATAIEYGLIAMGIGMAVIIAVQGIGSTLNKTFEDAKTGLTPKG